MSKNKNKSIAIVLILVSIFIIVVVINRNKLNVDVDQSAAVVLTQDNGPFKELVNIPEGVLVRTPYRGPIEPSALTTPGIDGIIIERYWGDIMTGPNTYNWPQLDADILSVYNAPKQNGKHLSINFSIAGGDKMPEFYYTQVGKYHKNTNPNGYLEFTEFRDNGNCANGYGDNEIKVREPQFWQQSYKNLVQKFANDFKAHLMTLRGADGELIYSDIVKINKIDFSRDTAEDRLAGAQTSIWNCSHTKQSTDGPTLWADAGYTPAKLLQASQDLSLYWRSAFPDKLFSFQLIQPLAFPQVNSGGHKDLTLLDSTKDLVDDFILNYATPLVGSGYSIPISFQWNGLAQNTNAHPGVALVKYAKDKLGVQKIATGYQLEEKTLGVMNTDPTNFMAAVTKIKNWNGLFVEIFMNNLDIPEQILQAHNLLNEAPTNPTNLTETHTTNSITLNWTPSTDNSGFVGYDVYDGMSKLGSANKPTVTLNNVLPGTTYKIKVVARDGAGNVSQPSNIVSIVLANGGNKPTVPYLIGMTNRSSVELNWEPSTVKNGIITKYIINRNGSYFAEVQNTQINYTDDTAIPGVMYTYVVRAKTDKGNYSYPSVLYTTKVESKDFEAPSVPTSISASNITNTSVDLFWDPSSDNIAVDSYDIYENSVFLVNSKNTNYNVTGLTPGTGYGFKIVARDTNNNSSEPSITKGIYTTGGNINPLATPSIPSGLHYSIDGTNVTVSWDPSTNAFKYRVLENQNYLGQVLAPDTFYTFSAAHGYNKTIRVIGKSSDLITGISGPGSDITVYVP